MLGKVKAVLNPMDDPQVAKAVKALKKSRSISQFQDILSTLT